MDSTMNQNYPAHAVNQYTPVKELPPSLTFGSSSSPYFESSPLDDQQFVDGDWSPTALRRSHTVTHNNLRNATSGVSGRHMSLDMVFGPLSDSTNDIHSRRLSGPANYKSASFPELLPQFPSAECDSISFGNLGSSPPISQVGRQQQLPRLDHSGSPKPKAKRTGGKRGRPRKYSINEDNTSATGTNIIPTHDQSNNMPSSSLQSNSQSGNTNNLSFDAPGSDGMRQRRQPRLVRKSGKQGGRKSRVSQKNTIEEEPPLQLIQLQAEHGQKRSAENLSHHDIHGMTNVTGFNKALLSSTPQKRLKPAPEFSSAAKNLLNSAANLDTSDITPGRKLSIYTDRPTSNGIPLISADVFRKACEMQGAKNRANLRNFLTDYRKQERHHFSTNGLGFNFTIDTTGTASIDKTQAVPCSPHGPQRDGGAHDKDSEDRDSPRIIDVLDEDSESDSEPENEISGTSCSADPVRTPPRFSSLGSADAATEFARTFGRTQDRGFMFLFPNECTPNKPVHLASNNHCTPCTPRIPVPFDEDSFSLQMQTPPGAIFSSYDYQAGNFVTGMTPYINGLERVGVNE